MNALSKIKQTGLKYSVAILFNRVVPEWLFRVRRFVVYRLETPEPNRSETDLANPTDSVSVNRCTNEAEIVAVENLTYYQRSYSTGNSIAYSVKLEDRLAAGMWAATDCFDENELGVRILLGENQTWLFAARVDKTFRRQGLYSKLLPFVMSNMAEQGFADQLVSVNPDNIGSNRIHQQRSRDTVGYVLAIRFLKTTFCWTWGDIAKEATVSWNSTSHPIGIRFDSSDE